MGLTDAGRTLELTVSDALRAANSLPDDPVMAKITVVEIEDKAMDDTQTYEVGGRWPWSRPKQAKLIDALASLGARWIVLDIEYSAAESSCVGYRPVADSPKLETYVLEKPDLLFRDSLQRAGNVVVPFSIYFVARTEDDHSPNSGGRVKEVHVPDHLRRFTVDLPPAPEQDLRAAEDTHPMIAELADAAAGSGYTSFVKREDPDQTVRRVPVLARVGDCVFPHLGVVMAGLWRFGPGYQVRLSRGRFALLSADGKTSVGNSSSGGRPGTGKRTTSTCRLSPSSPSSTPAVNSTGSSSDGVSSWRTWTRSSPTTSGARPAGPSRRPKPRPPPRPATPPLPKP